MEKNPSRHIMIVESIPNLFASARVFILRLDFIRKKIFAWSVHMFYNQLFVREELRDSERLGRGKIQEML